VVASEPGHDILHASGDAFPRRLRSLDRAPERLFVRGRWHEAPRSVAIVGARAASGHGIAAARSIAEELAAGGAMIVSGGAVGIDAAAHRGALAAGGSTVAVLGCGLDVAYPARNRPLFDDIVAAGGAVITPFPAGARPLKHHFVQRNHLIAALADAVIVIDSTLASGALHTAASAVALGRTLAAFPGTPGCEALIAQGAAVVESAADVLAALAGSPRRPRVALPEPSTDAGRVLAALAAEAARDESEVSHTTGLAVRQVARALTGLELEGLAVLMPGRSYVRSRLAQELLAG
jgi:DNA processing protein